MVSMVCSSKNVGIFFKDDFIRLFKDFYSNNVDLRSINSSFIALIPKKDNP